MAKNPLNAEEVRKKLKDEWSKISVDECRKLIESCGRRCVSVVESKRLFTKK